MSVLNSPLDRLYAGALLGSALSKELGEVGGQQTSHAVGARRATLTAGIASGKIKPSSLSKADASLLGTILSSGTGGKIKIPSIIGDPLGFIAKPVGSFLGEAGQAVGSLKGIPEALGTEILRDITPPQLRQKGPGKEPIAEGIEKYPGQVVHDFSSLRQIYEHPFAPALDVASIGSPALSALNKGAVAVRLAQAGKLAKGAELSPAGPIMRRLINLGSPEGRSGVSISPGFKGDTSGNVLPKIVPRSYATQRPFMKYAVQKPLDRTVSTLQAVPIIGPKLTDLQGGYYGRKTIARTHGQETAGASEEFSKGLVKDLIKSTQRMFAGGQGSGQYQWEAMILGSANGIDSLDKLDEYVNKIRSGEDVNGVIVTPEMQRMADYRANTLYQDPRFRQLIERPTDIMKETAYNLRRVNVDNGFKLDIAPQVSEDAALGRLREMTGKTNEQVKAELPEALRPQNEFAKGLHVLQESILGKPSAEVVPSIRQLANAIPYGTLDQRISILERAYNSLVEDIKGAGYELHKDPSYLQGNNLFEKVATAFHDELQVPTEQAMAFARGIALGSPDGPILPTYIPSVSGERLHFGIRPDSVKVKLGQMVGVSKFKPMGKISDQPTYYDVKRPFSPRSVSAQTIGQGPRMNYLRQADYGSFLTGTQRMDPEAIIRNAYHINKDIVAKKLNPQMLEKLAVPNPGHPEGMWSGPAEILEKLGTKAALYDFVPIDTYRNFFDTQGKLEVGIADAMKTGTDDIESQIEQLAEESAQKFVSEEVNKAAHGNTQGLAIPKTFIKTIAAHARISEQTSGVGRLLSAPVSVWKTAVLSFSPAWLARTSIGHGILALIDGTTNPAYWAQSHKYFAEDRPVLPEQVQALSKWDKVGDKVLNPEPISYGVNQGGLQQELEDIQGGPRGIGNLYVPRKISEGVHVQNNFQRRAIFLRKLDVGAKQRFAELGKAFDHPGGFWNSKNIDAVLDPAFRAEVLKSPDLVEHAFDQLGQVSYTFSQMSPWERQLVRYGIPFWGWRKFVTKFVLTLPFNYPGRAAALYALGKIGQDEHNEIGPMPDYLSGALWFDHSNLSHARYVNLYGLNPLSDTINPFGSGGPLEGSISLGQTSPIIQSALAGFGINPLTGQSEGIDPNSGIEQDRFGNYFDTKTGKPVSLASQNSAQRVVGSFLRSFPEIRNAELAVTGGNPVYPESIPFFDEHPIAVNPQTRRGNTAFSAIMQEIGIQPRSMDLAKYRANQLKSVAEAKKKNVKAIAKAKAKLLIPNP